jgi:transcriptional regulator with XRE-family HTH domain
MPNESLPDVFTYFRNGKAGIKERFAEQIRKGLDKFSLHASELETEIGLNPGTITAIQEGDYNGIDARLIENIADPVDLRIDNALGELINFDETEEAIWIDQAKQKKFVPLGGCEHAVWTPEQLARLFVRLRALKSL